MAIGEKMFAPQCTHINQTMRRPVIPTSQRRPMGLNMLHCTGKVTSLSCDYAVSSFLIVFKSYMNNFYKNTIRYKCHVTNQKLYYNLLNSTWTHYAKF